jgi:hypothetical protein
MEVEAGGGKKEIQRERQSEEHKGENGEYFYMICGNSPPAPQEHALLRPLACPHLRALHHAA